MTQLSQALEKRSSVVTSASISITSISDINKDIIYR